MLKIIESLSNIRQGFLCLGGAEKRLHPNWSKKWLRK